MEIYLFIGIVAFLAGFIQGLTGFGSVLLSLPLMALFLDMKTAVPLVAMYATVLSLYLLVQLWEHWRWSDIYPLFLGCIPGVPLGVWFLKQMDPLWIQWIIGIVLVLYSLYGLLWKPVVRGTKKFWAYAFGFASGFLGGAIAAAGPPVIVYTSLQPWSKDRIKVTLQGFFVASGSLVVFFQSLAGLVTGTVLVYFLAAIPLLLGGTWAGSLLYGRVREETYRKILFVFLAILGVMMLRN
jgi:hypothetical protein